MPSPICFLLTVLYRAAACAEPAPRVRKALEIAVARAVLQIAATLEHFAFQKGAVSSSKCNTQSLGIGVF
ncbi:MAG: hypothetical protein BCS36_03115 [Desulfovibrio sp. MES5]|nr:MAG: hypothetical protein BCS36_03115 [Desulfovibrio sp. MES5]